MFTGREQKTRSFSSFQRTEAKAHIGNGYVTFIGRVSLSFVKMSKSKSLRSRYLIPNNELIGVNH